MNTNEIKTLRDAMLDRKPDPPVTETATLVQSYICHDCKKVVVIPGGTSFSPNYGIVKIDGQDVKVCYDCCALRDKKTMRESGRIALYVSDTNDDKGLPNSRYVVTNWPGTLRFDVIRDKKTNHNWRFVGKVLHVWFAFDGWVWYGRHIGEFNNMVHCRQTLKRA